MTLDPIFVYSNYAEACLWFGLAIAAIVKRNSRASLVLGIALIFFGASDVVEAQTGAWYDPWWLFAWKAACVLVILLSGWLVVRKRKKSVESKSE